MAARKTTRTTGTKADAALNQIILTKKAAAEPQDGRLEVALAIAAVSSLVTVDATKHPFETSPDNLFDLTFNNRKVGISDQQMPAVKGALARLLPQIANDILSPQIPDNATLSIEKFAEFVEISLIAQRTPHN